MRFLIDAFSKSCDDSGIDLAKLAVIAAFFTLFGDFLAFIAAILALQQDNSCNDSKKQIKHHIEEMHSELERISKLL
ncbi:hypothetical protein [Alkaliphilus crotonatoxidans]